MAKGFGRRGGVLAESKLVYTDAAPVNVNIFNEKVLKSPFHSREDWPVLAFNRIYAICFTPVVSCLWLIRDSISPISRGNIPTNYLQNLSKDGMPRSVRYCKSNRPGECPNSAA